MLCLVRSCAAGRFFVRSYTSPVGSAALETLQELYSECNSLKDRLESVVASLKLGKNNNNFLQTKEYHLESVQSIVSQCDLLFEIQKDDDIASESSQFIESELESIRNKLDSLDLSTYLDSEEELGDALIYLTTGVGGDDSSDWTSMLKQMYEKWGELKGHEVNEIEVSEATHGIRNACIQICGENVYGLLKRETGVHRLVRISPFNAQGKRQTSFASVTVAPSIKDEISVQIRPSDIRIETKRASGPGGQHVNTTDSAVRITHIPTGITASASTKSQARNKKLALDVLKSRVYEHEKQLRGSGSSELKSSIDQQNWGSQIRNYVLHPYQTVTDLRTRQTSPQPHLVLNGTKLDLFLYSGIKSSVQTAPI